MTNVEETEIRDLAWANWNHIQRMLASINVHKPELEAMKAAYIKSVLGRHGIEQS